MLNSHVSAPFAFNYLKVKFNPHILYYLYPLYWTSGGGAPSLTQENVVSSFPTPLCGPNLHPLSNQDFPQHVQHSGQVPNYDP